MWRSHQYLSLILSRSSVSGTSMEEAGKGQKGKKLFQISKD